MSLALYRRYRPETFEEVIGQDHVTLPLQQALRNQRVNHAYLFSGPRGCGKTTSARILARCLNCEQGPTPTPCGVCRSCTDLTRGGSGSIDVIEIDAASHGGVDDARDLRERAFFAPVSARYKIYILDEAHMVSSAGFNALLKVVEEPPPHLKFIFATTEPEKVIGTIRSRTHHYPFRLVPPGVLRDYLAEICDREQITVDPNVLPLVVRAGAGSVRDAMSVLDQLLAGAGDDGVTYQMAVGLLGYTDAALLDEVVSAFAAHSGGAAFEVIDRVMEGGHDPRRFLADLLERLRDLVILAAVPDAAQKGLISAPGDQLARMQEQAAAFGPADLSRAADLVSDGLLEMRGATAPRLLLELVCARILLPGTDDSARGVAARLDRLERGGFAAGGMGLGAGPGVGLGSALGGDSGALGAGPRLPGPLGSTDPGPAGPSDQGSPQSAAYSAPGPAHQAPAVPSAPQSPQSPQAPGLEPAPWRRGGAAAAASGGAASGTAAASPPPAAPVRPSGPVTADPAVMRQIWPQVLEAVARRSKAAWARLSQSAHVVGVDGGTLQLGFFSSGLRDSFSGSKTEEMLREALREVSGADWRIDAIVDPSGGSGSTGPGSGGGPGGGFGGQGQGGGFGGQSPAAPAPAIGPPPGGGATGPSVSAAGPGFDNAANGAPNGGLGTFAGSALNNAAAGQPQAPASFAVSAQPGSPGSDPGSAAAGSGPPGTAPFGPGVSASAQPAAAAAPVQTGAAGNGVRHPTGPASGMPAAPTGPGSGSRAADLPPPEDFPPPPEDDYGADFDGADYDLAVSQSAAAGPLARDLLVRELGAVVLAEGADGE